MFKSSPYNHKKSITQTKESEIIKELQKELAELKKQVMKKMKLLPPCTPQTIDTTYGDSDLAIDDNWNDSWSMTAAWNDSLQVNNQSRNTTGTNSPYTSSSNSNCSSKPVKINPMSSVNPLSSTPNRFTKSTTQINNSQYNKGDQDQHKASTSPFTVLPGATQVELVKG